MADALAALALKGQGVKPTPSFVGVGGGEGGGGFPPIGGGFPPGGVGSGGFPTLPVCGLDITWTPAPSSDPTVYGSGPIVLNFPCTGSTNQYTNQSLGDLIQKLGILGAIAVLGAVIKSGQQFLPAPKSPTDTSGSGGEGPINITNLVNVTDSSARDQLAQVALTVQNAIGAAASNASSIAQQTAGVIANEIQNQTTAISQGVEGAVKSVQDTFTTTLDSLFQPTSPIIQYLDSNIADLTNITNGVVSDILSPIHSVLDDIDVVFKGLPGDILSGIAGGLTGAFKPLIDLLKELGAGNLGAWERLIGLLTGFFGGGTSALNDIAKVLEKIGVIWPPIVHSTISWDDIANIKDSLTKISTSIAGISGVERPTVFQPNESLTSGCDPHAVDNVFDQIFNTSETPSDVQTWIANAFLFVISHMLRIFPIVDQWMDLAREEQNRVCQLSKIDPGTVIRLWRRGIISPEAAKDELTVQGYADSRITALFDGSHYLESADEIIDHWWRGITSDYQLGKILEANGYDKDQIEATKTASYKITQIADAIEAYKRSLIDENQLDIVLTANRLDSAQRLLLKGLIYRPSFTDEALQGHLQRAMLGHFSLFSLTDFDTPPQWFIDAAHAEGLADDSIRNKWWAHWNPLDINTWITLQTRGLRSTAEYSAAMDRFGVPLTLQQDLLDSRAALIPFRSVPSFVKAGVMSESDARSELSKHGFSSGRIDMILNYANKATTKTIATAVTGVGSLSVGSAHTLFDEGAITKEQYVQILEAHSFTSAIAQAQADAAELSIHVKQRKQQISDAVAEVEAGQITVDQAIQQLTLYGLSNIEIARFQASVRRATTKNAKSPTLADLDKFIKAKLISVQQYRDELVRQGWQDPWLTAFMGLVSATPQQQATAPPGTP